MKQLTGRKACVHLENGRLDVLLDASSDEDGAPDSLRYLTLPVQEASRGIEAEECRCSRKQQRDQVNACDNDCDVPTGNSLDYCYKVLFVKLNRPLEFFPGQLDVVLDSSAPDRQACFNLLKAAY